jgi:hypothetical protein
MTYTIKEVNWPTVPENLILDINEVIKQPHVPMYRDDGSEYKADFYHVYKANDKLVNWVHDNIPGDFELIEYFVATKGLPMHKDLGRTQAFNYLLVSGGSNVTVDFYSNDQSTILSKTECKLHQWYDLNVGLNHLVSSNQSEARFLLSLTPRNAVTYRY